MLFSAVDYVSTDCFNPFDVFSSLVGLKDQVEAARSMVHGVVSKGPSAVAEYGNSQTIQVALSYYPDA